MKKTLLVLGAGASREYGLPCGDELRKWITTTGANELAAQLEIRGPFGHGTHDESDREIIRGHVDQFVGAFRVATTNSIDEFLHYQPTHRDLGRLAITLCLLPKEIETVSAMDYDRGVCRFVAQAFREPQEGVWPDFLDVITFNYDRTFELILASIYTARFGTQHADRAFQCISSRILHVYGAFSTPYKFNPSMHYFSPCNRWGGGFCASVPPGEYDESAKKIAVIGDERDSIIPRSELQSLVSDADRVYFLGFGFDKQTCGFLASATQVPV